MRLQIIAGKVCQLPPVVKEGETSKERQLIGRKGGGNINGLMGKKTKHGDLKHEAKLNKPKHA